MSENNEIKMIRKMGNSQSLQQIILEKLGTHVQKNKVGPLFYTIQKNEIKMDSRCKKDPKLRAS